MTGHAVRREAAFAPVSPELPRTSGFLRSLSVLSSLQRTDWATTERLDAGRARSRSVPVRLSDDLARAFPAAVQAGAVAYRYASVHQRARRRRGRRTVRPGQAGVPARQFDGQGTHPRNPGTATLRGRSADRCAVGPLRHRSDRGAARSVRSSSAGAGEGTLRHRRGARSDDTGRAAAQARCGAAGHHPAIARPLPRAVAAGAGPHLRCDRTCRVHAGWRRSVI